MVTYQLDTNVVIQMLRGDMSVISNVYRVGIENCCISEITIAELYYGAVKGKRQSNYDDIEIVKQMFRVVPIYDSLERLANIRLSLKKSGKMIDAYDMMIGATAAHNGYTLVTHNTKHYINVPDLMLTDWQEE